MPPTDSNSVISFDPSPSFNTYSSSTLAQIADRVVRELNSTANDDTLDFDDYREERLLRRSVDLKKNDENDVEEDDFEFAVTFVERDSSLISAEDVFCNGQIRPVYPLFDTDLLLENKEDSVSKPPVPRPVRQPLRKLFIEERDSPSCSSSEADELEGIQPDTYCVWRPEDGKCKKSNSTGSSKRWKFRDLLHRSNSDGKEETGEKWNKDDTANEGDQRRRSYKQDLVGLFANVGGLSRNIHPF